MKRFNSAIFLLPLFLFGCNLDEFPEGDFDNGEEDETAEYMQEMRDFVQEISEYAKGADEDFIVIPQNGVELISDTGDDTGSVDADYVNAIDGIGQESLFYGYEDINELTPQRDRSVIRTFLRMATDNSDAVVLITDYVFSEDRVDDSYQENADLGYISFAAEHEELDNIPQYPSRPNNRNSNDIEQLSEARNFLHLTNTRIYSTPQQLVNEISDTDYDLVILDFFFNGQEYTQSQIEQLKEKNSGGRRLLIAYINIGQADTSRYYWQNSWASNPPEWRRAADSDNSGHYYVEYWDEDWQEIIYGADNAYLDRIIEAGFDGVYLDRVNAFEHFED